jgi:tetratricopeptide (TPR) repeat protein
VLKSRLFLPKLGVCNGVTALCGSPPWRPRMAEDCLLEAVRGLRLAHPEIGPKPLLAKLREQHPGLGAGNKEVREALAALKAESEATEAAAAAPPVAAAPPAAGEDGAPPSASLAPSLACFGCARLPSEMGDGREKHPVCPICVKLKVLTTYWCCVNCPGNPGAWKLHAVYHKEVKTLRKRSEDGGVMQQRNREAAERQARRAAESGDEYMELMAEGARYISKEDTRRAARTYREAIALRPDRPETYYNLGAALANSEHHAEAAQRYLEAKERYPVGSEGWAQATASAFNMLTQVACAEVAKPEWWNDEELKALSARVVRAAPGEMEAPQMRAEVLSGQFSAWEAGPRSAAELKEAATHFDRAAALCPAPAAKASFAGDADWCRSRAEAMYR